MTVYLTVVALYSSGKCSLQCSQEINDFTENQVEFWENKTSQWEHKTELSFLNSLNNCMAI